MRDETTFAAPSTLTDEEERALAGAVRESVLRRVIDLVEHAAGAEARACPRCWQRVIVLDRPQTFVRRGGEVLCAACGAERDLVALYRPEADIGGEGG